MQTDRRSTTRPPSTNTILLLPRLGHTEFAKLVGRQPFGLAAGESGSTRQLVVNLVTRPKFEMVSRQKIE